MKSKINGWAIAILVVISLIVVIAYKATSNPPPVETPKEKTEPTSKIKDYRDIPIPPNYCNTESCKG